MKKYLFALAASAFAAGTTFFVAQPAEAQGFRAEVHGGWDHPGGNGGHDDGIVYGIGLGYDHQVGKNVLLGIDLSADLSSTKDCERSVILTNDEACLRARRDLAAAVRLGYKVGEQGTLYALAGYTNARFRFDYTTPAGVTTRDGRNLDGVRVGLGYQHDFSKGVYGKVEYRYSNYESDIDRHQVLLGVGVSF